jgi:hypothetical protein
MSTLIERFWRKVQKTDECWLWTAAGSSKGYGRITVGIGEPGRLADLSPAKWRLVGAHRVSWEIAHGAIPDGLWVLHRCDNPRCVRPDHFFLGTVEDNTRDALRKGRLRAAGGIGVIGEQHGKAKLKDADVPLIIAAYEQGGTITELANRLGMTRQAVASLLRGKTWRHLGLSTTIRRQRPATKLTEEAVVAMRAARASGENLTVIATRFGVGKATASQAINGRTWRHPKGG